MAKELSLRDFHASVASRLAAPADVTPLSWVGVMIGAAHWLVNLGDISEVVAVPQTTPVPHTRAWFTGIAGVRGNLYGIVDTAHFLGGPPSALRPESRILLAHPRFHINSGLLVTRMLGLRDTANWQVIAPGPETPPWVSRQCLDADGCSWQELDLGALLSHPDFLQVVRK